MSLSQAYRATRSLEAIENYAQADSLDLSSAEEEVDSGRNEPLWLDPGGADNSFWTTVLKDPESSWGRVVHLYDAVLSEWVARVPGLFWSEGATTLRAEGAQAVEETGDEWTVLTPFGKSGMVLGGIGTLRFPPNERGIRLFTLCGSQNASSGIPVLVFSEMWERYDLKEGDLLNNITAKWQKMDIGWAERFPSIKGIPRGYLVLESDKQIEKIDMGAPVLFHPCTVMSYARNGAILYDFVFATANTGVDSYRSRLEIFFASYRERHDRYGRYLISADIGEPLFDADYVSPSKLWRLDDTGRAHLELLEARVREDTFKDQTIDNILQVLTTYCDNDSLETIADHIGIPRGQWSPSRRIADSAATLLQICQERNKVEELIDAVAQRYATAFVNGG